MTSTKLAKRTQKLLDTTVIDLLKAAANPNVISLGGGIPASRTFPTLQLARITNQIMQEAPIQALQYHQTAGLSRLRKLIAHQLSQEWGRQLSDQNVLITTGSQQGLDLVSKALLDAKDIVLTNNPTYFVALQTFYAYEAQIQALSLTQAGPDLDQLQAKLQKKKPKFYYVIPTFQNPTGICWSSKTRQEVLVLAEKHGLTIIEDDPYSQLYFSQRPPLPLAASSEKVIYLGTFSKTLAPGLRVGFVVASAQVIRQLTLIKQSMDLHSAILPQMMVAKFLAKEKLYQAHLDSTRQFYRQQAAKLKTLLTQELSQLAQWSTPKGGMFFWLKLKSKSLDTKKLLSLALKLKVAYVPGAVFYVQKPARNTLRLSYATVTPTDLELAVKRLALLVKKAKRR